MSFVLGLRGGDSAGCWFRRKIWENDGLPCKIHNADFFDAYVVCGTNAISFTKVGYWIFYDSCGAGTGN